MAKNKDFLKKVVVLTFLGLIVLGFTVPGFINPTEEETSSYNEPRLCKNDAECYLLCDDVPEKVICLENLCQQNGCKDYNAFPFQDNPINFDLLISLNGETISLDERSNSVDLFVKFDNKKVSMYTSRLPLSSVLEKANLFVVDGCLIVDSSSYCEVEGNNSSILLNEEPFSLFNRYIPQDGDVIKITFD